ncbi:MAG TPA: EscU/YscU/HrcU family type III secretion system export apparatus switch protein [Acidobacteriaceae bacterium]|nr:EscU/YscU/HrcU family type III secretion system export apparatus switch protein [Acidobacteriaceae bacterium]
MADQNKTEQATPRQRKRARERGQVTRSRELNAALAMGAVAAVMAVMGHSAVPTWTRYFRSVLDSAVSDSIDPGGPLLFWTSIEAMRWVYPIMVAALMVSLVTALAQGGFVFAPEALSLKPERLSPASKLQQMVSLTAVSTILKSLVPFTAIGWVGYACVRSHWGEITLSSYVDAHRFISLMSNIVLELVWKSGLVLLVWGGVDYLLLWRKNENDLKMSREDIKEEYKQSDGNPQSKARLRKLQRQARKKQMLKATETATVVVTNPTHYAVALRYEVNMAAPIVVAKGLDNLAQKIKEIAWMRDIPVMENKPLAQALYKGTEVGDPIPAALYHAVAEILVLVYKAQAEVRQRETQRRAAMNLNGPVRSV